MGIDVYKLDKSNSATNISAQALAAANWTAEEVVHNQVKDFSEDELSPVPRDRLSSMVFIGHANTKKIGDYDADQFVARLAKVVGHNKTAVNHIYLVGCEVGKITQKGCLAQDITNKLIKAGFINVTVHAIASPEVLADEDQMVVSVINSAGAAIGYQPGHLHAFVMNKQSAMAYDEFENKLAQNPGNSRIKNELERIQNRSEKIVKCNVAKRELDKQQHTFIRDESPSDHLKRMRADADYIIDNQKHFNNQQIVLAFIAKRIQQLSVKSQHERSIFQKLNPLEKNPADLGKELKKLFDKIKKASESKYKKVLDKKVSAFSIYLTSSTHNLLLELQKENFVMAESIINYSDSNERKRQAADAEASPDSGSALLPPPAPLPVVVSDTHSVVGPVTIKGSVTTVTPPSSRGHSPQRVGGVAVHQTSEEQYRNLRDKKRKASADQAEKEHLINPSIDELSDVGKYLYAKTCQRALEFYVATLDKEIKERYFPTVFYPVTKEEKKTACERLANLAATKPDEFFAQIQEAINEDGILTSGILTDRAYTLLSNILAHNVRDDDLPGAMFNKPKNAKPERASLFCCF